MGEYSRGKRTEERTEDRGEDRLGGREGLRQDVTRAAAQDADVEI
jgi:hypothetical protein